MRVTIDTNLKVPHNDPIQEGRQERIDQEKEELKKEVEDLKKHVQQLKQGQQKIKIPANEITKVLISRAMKLGEEYFELPVENGIAKLPRTKV